MLKLLRIDTTGTRPVTEAELSASLEEGVDAGLIEEHEHQMVQNLFHLDDRPLTSLMVPYVDIDWLDESDTVETGLQKAALAEHGTHSWYPVCRGGLDEVRGYVCTGNPVGHGFAGATATPVRAHGVCGG